MCFPVAGSFIRSQGCVEWALVLTVRQKEAGGGEVDLGTAERKPGCAHGLLIDFATEQSGWPDWSGCLVECILAGTERWDI